MQVRRRVDAYLHQTRAVRCEALRRWASVLLSLDETERQSTRRPHRAPAAGGSGDDGSSLNKPIGQATVGSLKIEMDARAVVSDLLVNVGVTLGWGEAAELGVTGPFLAERPAQRGGPEGG